MCMIVREIHYQLTLAPWDSTKFTYLLWGHATTSTSQGLFWTWRKRAWVVAGDSCALGTNKNLILHKHYQIFWKEKIFSGFRADVGNLEFLKFQSNFWAFIGNCRLYWPDLDLRFVSLICLQIYIGKREGGRNQEKESKRGRKQWREGRRKGDKSFQLYIS